jgi:hypothetical protein
LEGAEIYCQRQEKVEGTRRQPMFLMEQWMLYIYIYIYIYKAIIKQIYKAY